MTTRCLKKCQVEPKMSIPIFTGIKNALSHVYGSYEGAHIDYVILRTFLMWEISHTTYHHNHGHVENDESWGVPIPEKTYKTLDASTKFFRFKIPFPMFAYPLYLLKRSPGKSGSHFNPYSDIFSPNDRHYIVTSTICRGVMVGVLFYLANLIGPTLFICLCGIPYFLAANNKVTVQVTVAIFHKKRSLGCEPAHSDFFLYTHTKNHDRETFITDKDRDIHASYLEKREELEATGEDVDDESIFYEVLGGHDRKRRLYGFGSYGKLIPSKKSSNDTYYTLETNANKELAEKNADLAQMKELVIAQKKQNDELKELVKMQADQLKT